MRKKFFSNRIWLKIVSLIAAILIWVVVTNISNPVVTLSKTVPLEVVNEDVITGVGKTYKIEGNPAVSVFYTIRTRDEYRVKPTDFRAYIDMKDLYDVTGSVPVSVEVVNNKDIFTDTPVAKPGVVHVNVEDTLRKSFDVSVNTIGEPVDGYVIGNISTNPSIISIRGPRSVISRISSVEVNIDVTDLSEDTTGTAVPVFLDEGGNRVDMDDDRIEISYPKVEYIVTTLSGKNVPLEFSTSGTPAEGYRQIGISSDLPIINIMGTKADLDGISSIKIPPEALNVSGADGNRTFSVEVSKYLPDGIITAGNPVANVLVVFESPNEKTFELRFEDMDQAGPTWGYTYSIEPETVSVIVSGYREELDSLTADRLNAQVDLTHLPEGRNEGKLTLDLPYGCEMVSHTPFEVIVKKMTDEEIKALEESAEEVRGAVSTEGQ